MFPSGCNNFGDPLTFAVAPSSGQHVHTLVLAASVAVVLFMFFSSLSLSFIYFAFNRHQICLIAAEYF